MPDWLIEKGIGETRAVRIEADEIVEARVSLDGTVLAGTVLEARLQSVGVGHSVGIPELSPSCARPERISKPPRGPNQNA